MFIKLHTLPNSLTPHLLWLYALQSEKHCFILLFMQIFYYRLCWIFCLPDLLGKIKYTLCFSEWLQVINRRFDRQVGWVSVLRPMNVRVADVTKFGISALTDIIKNQQEEKRTWNRAFNRVWSLLAHICWPHD